MISLQIPWYFVQGHDKQVAYVNVAPSYTMLKNSTSQIFSLIILNEIFGIITMLIMRSNVTKTLSDY